MTARATVVEGPSADGELLQAALRETGVVFGIDAQACAQLAAALALPEFAAEDVILAQGRAPLAGVDGCFLAAFAYGIQPGHVREDGTMDFMDRELLKPVLPGICLGELRPARPGTPGSSVRGEALPARPARELELELGEGVQLVPDGRVLAARPGVLHYVTNKKLDVVRSHEHTADVDLRSGHLDMEGSLVVRKSVQRPFRASASGDVEVLGQVEGGSVHAGGSVRVRGGVLGGESGAVFAGGDISARHAERARLVCGGLLKLESAINSELGAERIEVAGKLRGGSARAEQTLSTGEAGANSGTATLLAAGVLVERPLLEVRRALSAAKQERALRSRSFGPAREHGAKSGKLERGGATLARAELEHRVEQAARREQLVTNASVEVRGTAHAGVTVQIGEAQLALDQPLSHVRFSIDPGTRQVRWERPAK